MDGQRERGAEAGRGGWRNNRPFDATDQIKQLLRIPPDQLHPGADGKQRQHSQALPIHKQNMSRGDGPSGESPGNRHHRWSTNRYNDGRHGSPGNRQFCEPPRGHYDMPRNQHDMRNAPQRYIPVGRRNDNYGSPGRGGLRGYENMRYGGNNGPRIPLMNINNSNNNCLQSPDVEPPDFLPSPEVLAELELQFLFPLKKKSLKFPKAKYFCRLCDYHCDSLAVCRRHVMDSRHSRLKEAKDLETTLKNVPAPSDVQVLAIENLVKGVAAECRVDEVHARQRREVAARLSDLLNAKVKGCSLEVVGSTLSGFCLKSSDLNLDVVTPPDLTPSTPLLAVRDMVKQHKDYRDVKDDLYSSFPTISFTHCGTGVRVVVGVGGSSSKQTNQLLADYSSLDPRVATLAIAFRRWAQLSQIDDQSRGTLPPHVFPLMVVHFLQQHQPPVLPCLHELHPTSLPEPYLEPKELGNKWKCRNTESIGQLWIKLFRFYTVGFRSSDFVINVRQLDPITKLEKTWSKKIAVEDPFLQKRNLTRTVSGSQVFEYIADRFKETYRYFSIPQLHYGPLFIHIIAKEDGNSATQDNKGESKNKKADMLLESIEKMGQSQSDDSDSEDDDERLGLKDDLVSTPSTSNSISGLEMDISSLSFEKSEDTSNYNGMKEDDGMGSGPINLADVKEPISKVTPSQAAHLMTQLVARLLGYKFRRDIFTCGHPPPLICGSCQKEGHCKADCHEDDLPPLKPLPPLNNYYLSQLSSIIHKLQKDFEPTNEEIEERDRVVSDLESYIRQFFQSVSLQLFGSSANGFGFLRSDLDICLTFRGNPTGVSIDHIKIIESLAEKLKRYRQCGHVFAITTAKVPIVKFSIRRPSLEGDLSLYNTLALQNTKLLLTYANIDHRVKCLGYAMKHFAKKCDIGDASRGSLSSYAYILMVLHYLQQCRPPVIPVLQELYDHSKPAPQLMIDGWNAWFYNDQHNLKNVWKEYGRNKETVGQLWVGLLRYYTEIFNWKEHVVTIRQAAPLTRLQKLWNSKCIVIEDPFDLSHNLGAGLSRKMNTFIMKAFIRGREVFGTAISNQPPSYKNLMEYLFDRKMLTDGSPPNDRGCRFCGKIGHIQKDCPKKRANVDKRDKKDRQKERRDLRKHEETATGPPQAGPRQGDVGKEAKSQPPSIGSMKTTKEGVAPGSSPAPVVSRVTNAVKTDTHFTRQINKPFSNMSKPPSNTSNIGSSGQTIREQRERVTTTTTSTKSELEPIQLKFERKMGDSNNPRSYSNQQGDRSRDNISRGETRSYSNQQGDRPRDNISRGDTRSYSNQQGDRSRDNISRGDSRSYSNQQGDRSRDNISRGDTINSKIFTNQQIGDRRGDNSNPRTFSSQPGDRSRDNISRGDNNSRDSINTKIFTSQRIGCQEPSVSLGVARLGGTTTVQACHTEVDSHGISAPPGFQSLTQKHEPQGSLLHSQSHTPKTQHSSLPIHTPTTQHSSLLHTPVTQHNPLPLHTPTTQHSSHSSLLHTPSSQHNPLPIHTSTTQNPVNPLPHNPLPLHTPTTQHSSLLHTPTTQNPLPLQTSTTQNPLPLHTPTTQNPLPLHTPSSKNPLPLHTPTTQNPLSLHTPSSQNPLPLHNPSSQNPLPLHNPSSQNPLPLHNPSSQNPLPLHTPSTQNPLPLHNPTTQHTSLLHNPTSQLTPLHQSQTSLMNSQLSSHKKQEQPQMKVGQHLQQQGLQGQWSYWPPASLPQSLKTQKEEEKIKPPFEENNVIGNSGLGSQPHQQQYPYSISPAALFHMASQAAGGQVSAMMMPSGMNSQPGISSRSGLAVSKPSEDAGSPTTPAHPPPGFSAPVAIGYGHSQPTDPVNKLVMGSPLYRSPSSQSESQENSNSQQSFLTVSQAGAGGGPGPLTGIYLQQVGQMGQVGQVGGGTPYPNLALTSHTIPDSTLTYHTRHFLTQQMAQAQGPHQALQGPHQAMTPGPHQAMTPGPHQMAPQSLTPGPQQGSVTPGPHTMPQGPHQTVTQGLGLTQGVGSSVPGVPQGGAGVPLPPPGLPVSMSQGLSPSVSQVNLGTALSQGMAGMTLGHPLQQHPFPQPGFPQQGYQMAVSGGNGYYPEFVMGDPSLQNPSAGTQQGQPAPLPAEMMTDVAFQRADVYDGSGLQPLPPYLSNTLPQNPNLLSQPHPSLSHPLPSLAQQTLPQHPSLGQSHPSLSTHPGLALPHNNGPAPPYTPASLLYIDGERDSSQVLP